MRGSGQRGKVDHSDASDEHLSFGLRHCLGDAQAGPNRSRVRQR